MLIPAYQQTDNQSMKYNNIWSPDKLFKQLKIFWLSLVMVFIVVSLQYIGIHAPNLMQPFMEKVSTFLHPVSKLTSFHTTTSGITGGDIF